MIMNHNKKTLTAAIICLSIIYSSCKVPALVKVPEQKMMPSAYTHFADTTNSATIQWRNFFKDKYLTDLIDTAIKNNQELLITLQEIEIARNEVQMRQGQLLPFVSGSVGAGVEKVGRYTSQGAGDASTEIKSGKEVPEWLPDYAFGAHAYWEIDIWKKLRNARKAAVARYLSTIEGKNFVVTNLVAEIANAYYELCALDNQLAIVRQAISLQDSALEVMKVQKQAARVTELAVKKFEAEVLNSQSMEFDIAQKIKQTENELNFLLGRYPQPVERDTSTFLQFTPPLLQQGIPSQLLINRPDIRQAELQVTAARLDVKVARSEFYPSLDISASVGFNAFNPVYLAKFPASLMASLAGELAGPLINKTAIRAEFATANAHQLQAIYNYDKTILNAYIEVSSELSNLSNLQRKYDLKSKQVDTLVASIAMSNDLFRSARADYFEVLMTQRDALDAKLELIDTKLNQLKAATNIYRDLGGGWR